MNRSKMRRLIAPVLSVVILFGVVVGAARADDRKESLFARIRTVFDLVESMHKDGADLDTFVTGAIKGGLEALGDKHTNYFNPKEYKEFWDSLNGSLSGIGAYLEQEGSYVIILSPIKGTPADKAGLEPGDRILEANGTSLVGATADKAVQIIRGPAGTTVTLKLERPAEQRTFTVTITRAVINIPEVESKMLDGNVGYIALTQFGDEVVSGFYDAVASLKQQGAKAIVLDLRQNGGGYLTAAVEIASAFVPADEPVVWEVGREGKTVQRSTGRLINLPVAVLVNKGSASASEILAGAIQDYGAGPLVGTQTYGKGTVQQIMGLADGAGMKITIAEYLTPKERHVDGIGLTPDVVVDNPKPSSERTSPLETNRFLGLTSVGLDVLYLQYRLEDLGYEPDTDGFFGIKTEQAVMHFATDQHLTSQGMVDGPFVEALNMRVAERLKTQSKQDVQLQKALELMQPKAK